MSTSRGSNFRTRPQKHQNRTAFKNDLHDSSHKTKFLNSLEVTGVCNRCKDIIDWKIKYKKYKPLSTPRKCVTCDQKAVKYAYHMMCTQCAKTKQICAKCCKPVAGEDSEITDDGHNTDLKALLKNLPERKRRTILRQLNKQEDGQYIVTSEIKTHIEDILSKMDNIGIDDEDSYFSDGNEAENDEHST